MAEDHLTGEPIETAFDVVEGPYRQGEEHRFRRGWRFTGYYDLHGAPLFHNPWRDERTYTRFAFRVVAAVVGVSFAWLVAALALAVAGTVVPVAPLPYYRWVAPAAAAFYFGPQLALVAWWYWRDAKTGQRWKDYAPTLGTLGAPLLATDERPRKVRRWWRPEDRERAFADALSAEVNAEGARTEPRRLR